MSMRRILTPAEKSSENYRKAKWILSTVAISTIVIEGVAYFALRQENNREKCNYLEAHVDEYKGCSLEPVQSSYFNCGNKTDSYQDEHGWVYPHGMFDIICKNSSYIINDIYNKATDYVNNCFKSTEISVYSFSTGAALFLGLSMGWHFQKVCKPKPSTVLGRLDEALLDAQEEQAEAKSTSCLDRIRNRYRQWQSNTPATPVREEHPVEIAVLPSSPRSK